MQKRPSGSTRYSLLWSFLFWSPWSVIPALSSNLPCPFGLKTPSVRQLDSVVWLFLKTPPHWTLGQPQSVSELHPTVTQTWFSAHLCGQDTSITRSPRNKRTEGAPTPTDKHLLLQIMLSLHSSTLIHGAAPDHPLVNLTSLSASFPLKCHHYKLNWVSNKFVCLLLQRVSPFFSLY